MSDSKHDRLRFLFDRALDYTGSKRADFLERECRDDAELKARVEALLAAAEDEHFLAAPTGAPATAVAALHEGPGTRIGPYKLLQQIGEGGFGVVFMAEQEKPVTRRVALKIIKLGMDTRQVVARFEQERQALALMDHPNIARVIDAGATETGRPYFVMELVKGEPIVEYCDKHHLTIDERLALFEQVCLAVQHAHSKGIIHRDLKPSNILVGTQDGKPLAKIIDFGIAKAT
ncbi:MAG: serine/threonine protein kinase, partial [Planctomycetes bacterium]|nr:serine/threonine protein kinase [Planctomycetota bacterium]